MSSIIRQRISLRLHDLGISAGKASLAAGLSRSLLGKFLRGDVEHMRDDNLMAVAAILKCSLSWLRGETDETAVVGTPLTSPAAPPIMSLVAEGVDKARIHVEGTVNLEIALAILELFRKGQPA